MIRYSPVGWPLPQIQCVYELDWRDIILNSFILSFVPGFSISRHSFTVADHKHTIKLTSCLQSWTHSCTAHVWLFATLMNKNKTTSLAGSGPVVVLWLFPCATSHQSSSSQLSLELSYTSCPMTLAHARGHVARCSVQWHCLALSRPDGALRRKRRPSFWHFISRTPSAHAEAGGGLNEPLQSTSS